MTLQQIMKTHAAEIEATGRELAINFDAPAQGIINAMFARIGVARFTRAGDDVWQQIECAKNGWEYARPPRRLIDRWAAY